MQNQYVKKKGNVPFEWKNTNWSTSIATCLSFLHSSECKSTNCCYVEILYTIPQLTLGGSRSKLAAGQMASSRPLRIAGGRGGHEGAGSRALSHTAQRSESHLSAGLADSDWPVFGSVAAVEMAGIDPVPGKMLHMRVLVRGVRTLMSKVTCEHEHAGRLSFWNVKFKRSIMQM